MRHNYKITFISPEHDVRIQPCDDWGFNDLYDMHVFFQRKDVYNADLPNDTMLYAVARTEVLSLELLPLEEVND